MKILLLLLLPFTLFAQLQRPNYSLEAGGIMNTAEQKAFWLISNQDGRFSPDNHAFFAEIKLGSEDYSTHDLFYHPQADTNRSFHIDYGLDFLNVYNGKNRFVPLQYYLKASWKGFHLTAGAKKRSFGLQYDPLSSGGLLYSGNAQPIPEITFSSEYITVPFTKGLFEIKGYFSHGWFEKDRYVKSPYYHHKNLYARLGKSWPVTIEYGFHHYAQWGGISPDYGKLNSDWKDYLRVVLAKSGSKLENEIKNVYGNHLGSQNLKITWKHDKFDMSAYWITIFEDGSGKQMDNAKDGLWGIQLHRKKEQAIIRNVVYEFLHTMHQSGRFHHIDSVIKGGNDNYFNNYLYRDGWTHHGFIIGTPFITSPSIHETIAATANNRVIAHHLGVNGYISEDLSYRALLSWSRNYGTNNNPFSPGRRQFSSIAELHYQLPAGWMLKGAVAADTGDLLGSQFSFMFSATKNGLL